MGCFLLCFLCLNVVALFLDLILPLLNLLCIGMISSSANLKVQLDTNYQPTLVAQYMAVLQTAAQVGCDDVM